MRIENRRLRPFALMASGNIVADLPSQQQLTTAELDDGRTVLIATDFSENGRYAVDWARDNLLRRGDTAILLNVRSPQRVPIPYGQGLASPEAIDALEHSARDQSRALLTELATSLHHHGFRVMAVSDVGDPRDRIVQNAQDFQVDAVVVGSRGLGAMSRLVLGSVSQDVVHRCTLPVLVVRMPK